MTLDTANRILTNPNRVEDSTPIEQALYTRIVNLQMQIERLAQRMQEAEDQIDWRKR